MHQVRAESEKSLFTCFLFFHVAYCDALYLGREGPWYGLKEQVMGKKNKVNYEYIVYIYEWSEQRSWNEKHCILEYKELYEKNYWRN